MKQRITALLSLLIVIIIFIALTGCTSAQGGGLVGAAIGSTMGLPAGDVAKMAQMGTVAGGITAHNARKQAERDRQEALKIERERLEIEKEQASKQNIENLTPIQDDQEANTKINQEDAAKLASKDMKQLSTDFQCRIKSLRLRGTTYYAMAITDLPRDGAFYKAGVRKGDVIVMVEGYAATSKHGCFGLINKFSDNFHTDRGLKIRVSRKGDGITFHVRSTIPE